MEKWRDAAGDRGNLRDPAKTNQLPKSVENGVAERWVGNCRRDMLHYVIVLNKRHLKRLMNEYVRYYHEDRTHLALAKETPAGRKAVTNSGIGGRIMAMPRRGGLHHRYDVAA